MDQKDYAELRQQLEREAVQILRQIDATDPLVALDHEIEQQVLIMAPSQFNITGCRIAMPTLLAADCYSLLGRIFILQPLAEERSSDWTLVSKSCVYGADDLKQYMESGSIVYSQTICA